jgi:putative lysine/arginine/ornithine/histidine/octopine transport system permease protein
VLDFSLILHSLPALLRGAWVTTELVAASLSIGFCIALSVALLRVSRRPWLWMPAYAYIFFFRGTPLLVQIYLVYYGFAQLAWAHGSVLWIILREPYACALIAFGLNTGAYTAEIFRGAIQAVPAGEIEAGRSLGMSRFLLFRRIVFPKAFRIALSAYGNEIILMLKNSSLASTITIVELTGATRSIIARTYAPIELFLAAAGIYLLMTLIITRLFGVLERRLSRHLGPAPAPAVSRITESYA